MPFLMAKYMPDRDNQIEAFLKSCGWQQADRSILADDASARRYLRLTDGDRRSILMDAPPAEMSVMPFLRIARYLTRLGFSAPEIIAEDPILGLVLMEDFGDDTYNRVLQSNLEQETELYALAVDAISSLHRLPEETTILPGIVDYSENILLEEVSRFLLWFVPATMGEALTPTSSDEFRTLWADALKPVYSQPRTLVLRDFHIDNLIYLENRDGARRCGMLDFQDAVVGAGAYDLMSLLEDARRDIEQNLIIDMRQRYFQNMNMAAAERDAFDTAYAILGAQRHTKIIGLFTRLCVQDAKPAYLVHIPRVWRLLEQSLCHPALTDLKTWFDIHIPEHNRGIPPQLAEKYK